MSGRLSTIKCENNSLVAYFSQVESSLFFLSLAIKKTFFTNKLYYATCITQPTCFLNTMFQASMESLRANVYLYTQIDNISQDISFKKHVLDQTEKFQTKLLLSKEMS